MAEVSGMASSYTLPQYVGELFQKAEKPNAFLRLVGGLTGGRIRTVGSTEFPMGVDYELPAAAQPDIVEGATPTASNTDTAQSQNVVQIFQKAVELSYSKQAERASIDGVAVIPGYAGNGPLQAAPGTLEFQIQLAIQKVARDVNYTFLQGAYQKPANNSTSRRTRGIVTAVSTNLFANGGTPRALSTAIFDAAMKSMVSNGAFTLGAEVFAFANADQVENLVDLYKSQTSYPESREVVGVAVRRIMNTWGITNVVYDPDMPAGKILIAQPQFCRPVFMPIPGKGLLFAEPLSKAGSSDKWQVYGEIGLDYRHEIFHGVIADLSA